MPTARSTTAGSTGKRKRSYLTRSALTTSACIREEPVAGSPQQTTSPTEWSPPLIDIVRHRRPQPMDGAPCILHISLSWLRDDGLEGGPDHRRPNLVGGRTTLSRPPGRGRGGAVPPRARRAARPRLPRGQRGCAADGVAAHPAAGLAGRRRPRRGGGAGGVGGTRAGAGRAAGLGHARSRRHDGGATPGGRGHRRARHRRRRQHDRRRLRADGGLGAFRNGRRRHAGPGPSRRASVHRGRAGRAGHVPPGRSARRNASTCT